LKDSFYHLDESKRRRIENAAIEEFGTYGYERGSTDRIIRSSGISKGGLYEYIESKESLFLHVVEHSYGALYNHIVSRIRPLGAQVKDLLARVRSASEAALDFYLDNPAIVRLIASLSTLNDPDAKARAEAIFQNRFMELFADCDASRYRHSADKILDLVKWLLVKTRNDFISELENSSDKAQVSEAYLADWDFLLSVLQDGIYC